MKSWQETDFFSLRSRRQRRAWGGAKRNPRTVEHKDRARETGDSNQSWGTNGYLKHQHESKQQGYRCNQAATARVHGLELISIAFLGLTPQALC
jgi:hypothetical protein